MKSAIRHRTLVTLASAVGVLALTLVATPSALAQLSGVVLTGSIADAAGEAMEGVVVSVRAEGSNLTTSVYTDADGVYVFPHMTPGPYRLRAQAVSYAAGHAEPRLSATKRRLGERFTYHVYPDMDRGFFGGSSGAIDYEALIRGREPEPVPSQTDTASARVTDAVRLAWNRTLDFLR